MINCSHPDIAKTADGQRLYCVSCGQRVENPPVVINYQAAMEDSRRLNWRKVGGAGYVVELGRVYIGASWDEELGIWRLMRVQWCDDCKRLELVQPDRTELTSDHIPASPDYLAPDLLGTPLRSLEPLEAAS